MTATARMLRLHPQGKKRLVDVDAADILGKLNHIKAHLLWGTHCLDTALSHGDLRVRCFPLRKRDCSVPLVP